MGGGVWDVVVCVYVGFVVRVCEIPVHDSGEKEQLNLGREEAGVDL